MALQLSVDDGGNDIVFSQARAYATSGWIQSCPSGVNICVAGRGVLDSKFGSGAIAEITPGQIQACSDPEVFEAYALASVGSNLITLFTTTTPYASCSPTSSCSVTGASAAVASASIELDSGSESGGVSGTIFIPTVQVSGSRRLAALVVTLGPGLEQVAEVLGAAEAVHGRVGFGLTLNGLDEQWEGSVKVVASGGDLVEATYVDGLESSFDVQGDGRFSALDVSSLTALFGTPAATDPENLDRYDFDASEAIDQGDATILNAMLDAGLGSGVFGDHDSDGDADCNDYAAVVNNFVNGSVLGDPNYEISYDFDLDGDNDAVDRDQIRRLLSPADMAAPFNVLDFTDVIAFNTAYGAMDPAADLAAPYGTFDFTDVIAFNEAYANGCPN